MIDNQATADLARQVTEETTSQLPQEKLEGEQAMIRTANELAERGSDYADGRGQAIGSIPPRIYMRWNLLLPGCWNDKTFVEEFLQDNPQCRCPGYRPRPTSIRNTFRIGGDFYQKNKHLVTNGP